MITINSFGRWDKILLETPNPLRQKYIGLFARTLGYIYLVLGLLAVLWYFLAPWMGGIGACIALLLAACFCGLSRYLIRKGQEQLGALLLYATNLFFISVDFWQTQYFIFYLVFVAVGIIGLIMYGRLVAGGILVFFAVQSYLYTIILDRGLTAPDGQVVKVDLVTLSVWWGLIGVTFWLTSTIYNDLIKDNSLLRQSEERLTLAQQIGNIGNYTYHLATEHVTWSDQMFRINGLEPGQIEPSLEAGARFTHPDDAQLLFQKSAEAVAKGYSELEMRVLLPSGQPRHVWVKISLIHDSEGKPESLLGTVLDISERKQADLKIQEQTARTHALATLSQLLAEVGPDYAKVLDTIAQQISVVIGDGCSIDLVSEDGQRLELAAIYHPNAEIVQTYLGIVKDLPLGVDEGNVGQVFRSGQLLLQSELSLEQVLATVPPEHQDVAAKFRIYSRIILPLKAQGRIIGVLALSRYQPGCPYTLDDQLFLQNLSDRAALAIANARLYISLEQELAERKVIQAERENLIAALETKNAELERFTYTVSHDLKSPLITIRGFLGYLEKDALSGNTARLKTDIGRISDATIKMQRLLDELLELSRIGRIMRAPERVPFDEIAAEAVAAVEGQRAAGNVQIEVAHALPVVCGDRIRLVEALQNLLDNAIKFKNEQAQPVIQIGQHGWDDRDRPIFFVKDNGLGVDPRYHEKIFGLFDKLEPNSEGTGVGLALVKRIIEVHEGRIWVESEGLGRGTTFFFNLPSPKQSDEESLNAAN